MTTTPTLTVPPEIRARFPENSRFVDLYGDADGAAVYDDIGFSNTAEIYEILAALRGRPGSVLELAAGSGRVTLPLVRARHAVIAVDNAPDMLALLRDRVEALGSPATCEIRCADMVDATRSANDVDAIVIATTSISLLPETLRGDLFAAARAALRPDGILVMSTVDAIPTDRPEDTADAEESIVLGASGTRHRMVEYWPTGASARHLAVAPADDPAPQRVHLSRVGVVGVNTLTSELEGAGFTLRRTRTIRDTVGTRHHYVLLEAVPT